MWEQVRSNQIRSLVLVAGMAALLLVLYNSLFILPLVVVFALVYFGTTSMQLGATLRRHAATVKLAGSSSVLAT